MRNLFLTLLLLVSGPLYAHSQPASQAAQEGPPEEFSEAAAALQEDAKPYQGAFEKEGIRVEFQMGPAHGQLKPGQLLREGDEIDLSFRIRDTNSGLPLGGIFPAAWMDRVPPNAEPETCSERVGAFLSGSLISRAEVDFNVYHVLALNSDASITVVDPLFGFGTTKLLDLIHLESRGEDWVLDRPNKALYVAMPQAGKVAVVDLATWDVKTNLEAVEGVSRVAVQPDGRYLWASFDHPKTKASGVIVFDTASLERKASFETPAGKHELAFTPDSEYAFVSSSQDGSISVFDIRGLSEKSRLDAGMSVVSMAYSKTAQALYALDPSGSVAVIDAHSHQVRSRITLQPGATHIRISSRPTLAFVINPEHDLVNIIDVSRNKVVQTGSTEDGPDQVAFTDELAYIRHRDSELILMIPLKELGEEGAPVPMIDFPGGRSPMGKVMPAAADTIVQAPGATAVLVANSADTAIYYYREGMAAPMGHFQNYGRQPRAVMAVDRSLTEFEPGLYGTSSTLRRPGQYELAFFLDSPRIVHCFSVEVASNPAIEAKRRENQRPVVEPLNTIMSAKVGEETVLRFRLQDPASGTAIEGLKDLRILTFRAPGVEQKRTWAQETSPGLYEVTLKPSQSGIYYAFASSPTVGLAFNESPFAVIRVKSGPAGAKGEQ